MPQATCILNTNRREYVILRNIEAETRSLVLEKLEIHNHWDLRNDNIFISVFTSEFSKYKRVTDLGIETGGRIEHELLGYNYLIDTV